MITHADGLELESGEQVCTIVIRRPDRRNAMSRPMWQTLPELLAIAARRAPMLVITGAGDDFCAGADVREFGGLSLDEVNRLFADMQTAIEAMAEMPIPTIAAIEGFALGAGLLLALACDLRVAGRGVRMGMPVARFGITVTPAFIRPLLQAVGPDSTRALLLTGHLCRPLEALQLGMAHRLVSAGYARSTSESLAIQMAGYSHASLMAAREAVRGQESIPGQYVDPVDFPARVSSFLGTNLSRPRS